MLLLGHREIVGCALSIFNKKRLDEANFHSQQQEAAMPGNGGDDCGKVISDEQVLTLADDDNEEEDDWARAVRQTKAASAGTSLDVECTPASTAADEANDAYTAWPSMRVDWRGFLTKVQKVPKVELDIMKIKIDDCLYLAEHVDIQLGLRPHQLQSQKPIHSMCGCFPVLH